MAQENQVETTGLMGWIDQRFPLTKMFKEHMSEYYAPKNFNFWYFFGVLAMVVMGLQIVTGIFLTMHYKPDAALAFQSVEYIMRDVPWGWLIRYLHSTGASAFFIVVYLHMFRGLLYGSYRKPRELIWLMGCGLFLILMAEAFMGYLLPWGQMSFWGAQVIVNMFSSIPYIGEELSIWIRGDFVVSDATLNRFFAFHVATIPLILVGVVAGHIIALHHVGSNNPDGIEIKEKKGPDGIPLDGIAFHPYYSVHDTLGVAVFLFLFSAVVFFGPEFGGYFLEYNNFYPANPLQTPAHIAPVWYFTPFYSILRAITDEFMFRWLVPFFGAYAVLVLLTTRSLLAKVATVAITVGLTVGFFIIDAKFWGVVAMFSAVMVLFALPWLDRSPAKSMRYRPRWHTVVLGVFVVVFVTLGFFGVQPVSPLGTLLSQIATMCYFGFFLLMPWWSTLGSFRAIPERVVFRAH
ncbi:MAG: cytochrome bc complex cytochrome b subunit [Burkholderiaceae bacterium]|nr:cytochrome bc complex cytochrome b subunit [Burkholderiaceae bacterium]